MDVHDHQDQEPVPDTEGGLEDLNYEHDMEDTERDDTPSTAAAPPRRRV